MVRVRVRRGYVRWLILVVSAVLVASGLAVSQGAGSAAAAGVAWRSVDAGGSHVCGISVDGNLWCWGSNGAGQVGDGTAGTDRLVPTRIGTATTWASVSAGGIHTCATRINGSLWCWGSNRAGQLGIGTTTTVLVPIQVGAGTSWSSVSAGTFSTCGTETDGGLWCWGLNDHGEVGDGTAGTDRLVPTRVGTATTWASVAAGATFSRHACGTRTDGTLWCWGQNQSGQVGDGTAGTDRLVPTRVGAATTWASVSAAGAHSCGIRTDGSLWCWGENRFGQVGDATSTDRLVPTRVGTATTWASVDAGNADTCAIRAGGSLWCWGANEAGQVGDGTTSGRRVPTLTRVVGVVSWAGVTVGPGQVCGWTGTGVARCWGDNGSGQFGVGYSSTGTTAVTAPARVFGGAAGWSHVATGQGHSCGIRTDTSLWCWGNNSLGQIGVGRPPVKTTRPTQVGADTWSSLTAGGDHTCGIRTDRSLWCWGWNRNGQVGDGTAGTDRLVPTRVGTATTWASVSGGGGHSCGTRTDGSLWCWGRNDLGQVGDGTAGTDRLVPTRVGTATTWASVSGGGDHSCGTRTDGSLWCWGRNDLGQVGDGTTTEQFEPIRVGTETTWASVSSGGAHTCGTRTDGSLWCWGYNAFRQLGDGTTIFVRLLPTRIGTETTWASVSAGGLHTCGTWTDGTLWCWGMDGSGQVGDGPFVDLRRRPHRVGNLTAWTRVGAGANHTCAVRADASLFCWGLGDSGQLGYGLTVGDVPVL